VTRPGPELAQAGSVAGKGVSERIKSGLISRASVINADGTVTTGSAASLVLCPFSTMHHPAASALVLEVVPESGPNTFLPRENQCHD